MDDGGFANGCSHEEEIPDMENEIECDEFDEEMDVDCDGPSQVVRKMNGKGWHSETSTGKKTRERQGKTNEPPPEITQWIEENYEVCKGSHVARETVYSQYCHFCQTRGHVAVNSASFGKIMHQHFKGYLKTRRLGTRGQSKYHYEGVQIKEDSEYFGKVESFKSLAGEKKEIGTKGKPGATSPGFNVGSLLPSFPNAKDLDLTPELKSTVETFIMMYRTHCQRILIAVSRANFDDVHSFLLHFWQGLPDHLQSLLELDLVTDIVGYCDCLLSKVIIAILIASPLQALPDSLTTVIRQFSCQFQKWLDTALSGVPAKMLKQKKVVAKEFCKSLRRQTALTELCQSVRNIVRSRELISQMISDWKELDLNSLVSQCLWTIFEKTDSCQVPFKTAYICLDQFQCLLENQLPLEKYAQWIETLMMEFTVMRKRTTDMTSEDTSREFLLKLSFCTAALIKDLTLHSSPSFGSYHLLFTMFTDYIAYVCELHGFDAIEKDLKNRWSACCVKGQEDKAQKRASSNLSPDSTASYTTDRKQPQEKHGEVATHSTGRRRSSTSPLVSSISPNVQTSTNQPTVPAHQHYPAPNSGPVMMGIPPMQPMQTLQHNPAIYGAHQAQHPNQTYGSGQMYGYGGMIYGDYESTMAPAENTAMMSDHAHGMIAQGGYFPPQTGFGQPTQGYPDMFYGAVTEQHQLLL